MLFSNSLLISHYIYPLLLLFSMTWIYMQRWVPGGMPAFCQKEGLSWRQPYIFYTVWRELRNEDDQLEKADWWQNQTRLTHCSRCHWTWIWTSTVPSWSVTLHAARLYYYSIQIIWLDFFVPLSSHNSFFFKCLLSQRILQNNVWVPNEALAWTICYVKGMATCIINKAISVSACLTSL